MNRIFIIGSLGKDPEMRSTQQGTPVCTFNIATNSKRGDKDITTWFRVTTWRGLAENCYRFLRKGNKVGVTGSLTMQSYTGNDGQQRYSLDVQADEVEFLTPKGEQAAPSPGEGFIPVDDSGSDLPF